ncbi:hypothetical protein BGW80DRAFT_498994 [Lactifluus volemus]|nr:hypothetical protein BGW80DRAFT_498994 [Lactifluus volemus]
MQIYASFLRLENGKNWAQRNPSLIKRWWKGGWSAKVKTRHTFRAYRSTFFIFEMAPREKWSGAQNVMTIMRRFLFCCSIIIIIIIIKTSNHLHHQLLLCLSDKTSLLHPEEEARGRDDGTYVLVITLSTNRWGWEKPSKAPPPSPQMGIAVILVRTLISR